MVERGSWLLIPAFTVLLGACGDRCDRLCAALEQARKECGVVADPDFARTCRSDWTSASSSLTSRRQTLDLQVCADTRNALDDWDCEQVRALYDTGPTRR